MKKFLLLFLFVCSHLSAQPEHPNLNVRLRVTPQKVKQGEPVYLQAEVLEGEQPFTFTWQVDETPLATDSELPFFRYAADKPGTVNITVTVKDGKGTEKTSQSKLEIEPTKQTEQKPESEPENKRS